MTKTTTKTKANTAKPEAKAYLNHVAGSRKGMVHQEFDKKGIDAAKALGAKLELAPGTIVSWMSGWSKASKPTTKATPKKSAKEYARERFTDENSGTIITIPFQPPVVVDLRAEPFESRKIGLLRVARFGA